MGDLCTRKNLVRKLKEITKQEVELLYKLLTIFNTIQQYRHIASMNTKSKRTLRRTCLEPLYYTLKNKTQTAENDMRYSEYQFII